MPVLSSATPRIAVIAATIAAILPFAAAGAAFAAPAAGADLQSTAGLQSAVQSGSAGKAITLENNASFSGYDAATDASGRSYIGWIGDNGNGKERQVHLCTLLPGSRSCKGGIQTIDAIGDSSAHDLHVFTTPGGKVTLVWAHDADASESGPQGSEIATATSQAGGPLSAAADQATSPSFGTMLDAGMAPNGQIWVLSEKSVADGLQVRPGLNNAFVNLKTPFGVGAARVAFNHGTPVIVIQKAGAISAPVAYTSFRNGKFAAFGFVKHTWTAASNIGLVGTSSGVRLDTSVANATYRPEVWNWTGNGFGSPTQTGVVHDNCTPSGHDLVTDASGRVADITNECGFVVVANAPGTRKAATFSFPEHGTAAGGDYQITTTRRGTGWAIWGIESTQGDKISATPIVLPGEEVTATKTVKGNRVTVTGPASCLPPVNINVGVKGSPAKNWHVIASTLRLGHKVLHTTLNGAGLKPGATYALSGTVKFANGGSHATITAQLKFRSCPN